ncbi:hypothetical protein BC936DRAFT_149779 [Jimgerdemannia flammicorona]|uniref:Magnesium transporter n=1 Tax=Jimgerdemannia flammicorona TaxID=994334 RepID=A0A433D052_9FUNG|nr:hypothetical protein BC936DRAFT_149779 [Jimgerdemannia flammicorona]
MATHSTPRHFTALLKTTPTNLTRRLHTNTRPHSLPDLACHPFFTPNHHPPSGCLGQVRTFSRSASPLPHNHTNFFASGAKTAWISRPIGAGSARGLATDTPAAAASSTGVKQSGKMGQKNEMKLRCTEFDHSGSVKTTAGEFLKSELCAHHGLQPRDLRKIDTHLLNQMPAILVRSEAILVNLAHIRALIKADLVVLFDSYGSTDSYNQSIFVYDLQERLRLSGAKAGGLPFEFRALEAIFISVISSLQSEMEVLDSLVTRLLAELEERIEPQQLKELLQYTKKLSKFEKDVLSIRGAITEVLEQDEDLAAMYLTAKKSGAPRDSSDHEEIELLLETYLKQVEEIANTATTLLANMRSTEEISNIILDANRNALLLFELKLAMGMLGVSGGALIASLFGMNLRSYMEENPYAFGIVSGGAIAVVGITFWVSLRKMRRLVRMMVC